MRSHLLLGGGGHCHACIDVIEREGKYRVAGIVLPNKDKQWNVMGYPILGCDDELPELLCETPNALIAVGQFRSAASRTKLFDLLKAHGASLPVIQSRAR